MKTRNFGHLKTAVPVIGQGTWEMPTGGAALEAATAALRQGINAGMVHIDTAEMYGSGKSEELVGKAIAGMPRDQLFIVSKVLPQNASFAGTIKACESSLKRLRTDYLDCYLLHWRGSVPLAETMRGLEQLIDDGKIRSLGVSNFDVDDIEEALPLLKKHKIACNQVLYNPYQRGIERELLPLCIEKSIALVAYTPFGQKSIPSASTAAGAVLAGIAQKHEATASQVILAFLVRHPQTFTIPKAAKSEHIADNAAAGEIELDEEDIAKIDAAFPAPKRRIPLEMI